jgi:hypothetical protein
MRRQIGGSGRALSRLIGVLLIMADYKLWIVKEMIPVPGLYRVRVARLENVCWVPPIRFIVRFGAGMTSE